MIDREKVIEGLHCCSHTDGVNCIKCPYNLSDSDCTALMSMDVLELLKEQDNCENCAIAIEDRQPIVRCKDCKHYDGDENSRLGTCLENGVCSTPEWFCADGEMGNRDV